MTEYIFATIYTVFIWVASCFFCNSATEAAACSAAILSGLAYVRVAFVYDEIMNKDKQ